MDLDSFYLLQNNWMLCQNDLTVAQCAVNAINLYPDCWAQRTSTEPQGFMFYNQEFKTGSLFTDGYYIVHGFCYNSKLTSSNEIMVSKVKNSCKLGKCKIITAWYFIFICTGIGMC